MERNPVWKIVNVIAGIIELKEWYGYYARVWIRIWDFLGGMTMQSLFRAVPVTSLNLPSRILSFKRCYY